MKTLFVALLALVAISPVLAQPFTNGGDADGVLGQAGFTTRANALQADGLSFPGRVTIGPSGKLFVSDCNNSRVLRWASADSFIDGSDAEAVFGQSTMTSGTNNAGGAVNASTLDCPQGLAFDAAGRLWVADQVNNRVLRFDDAEAAGNAAAADGVLGQSDFTSNQSNRGGSVAANTFDSPYGVAVDGDGRLWVADRGNNRVLRFDDAAAVGDGASADGVLGQSGFTTSCTNTCGTGNATSATMDYPYDVVVDAAGVLWVADRLNSRVLRFDGAAAKADGAAADGVLGQADFTSKNENRGGSAAANTMDFPHALALDYAGRLFVADRFNSRVLWFDDAANKADGAAADGVLGQADFTSTSANRGNVANPTANTLSYPSGLAVDSALDILWVVDQDNNRVLRFDAASGTLPVELTTFTARRDGRQVQLAWTTASETNNAGFHVERSADGGATFQAVGYVEGRGTAGGETRYRYTDAAPARDVVYRLKQVDFDGRFSYGRTALAPALVEAYALEASYPNPFNPVTTIAYETPVDGAVRLAVYDVLGKEVAVLVDGEQAAGRHAVSFDAAGLPSGIYFYRMTAGSASFTRTMQLMK